MAMKKAKRVAKKAPKPPTRKAGAKMNARKAGAPGRRSTGAGSAKSHRLPAASLAKLGRLAAAGRLDSEAAFDLDAALLEAVTKRLGKDDQRFAEIPDEPAMFWAAWWLEGEVNNGGFHQFFFNKGPAVAAMAQRFFKEHGPKDVAQLLDRAIKKLPGGRLPGTSEDMMALLTPEDPDEDERLMAAMEKLDSKFFEREGTSLLEARLSFVIAHPSEFFA